MHGMKTLPAMHTTQSWRYPENWVPLQIILQLDISNIWAKLLGSTISPQDVLSGEEDGKIPNYIHLENSRRNCPNCWNEIIHIDKAGSPVPQVPQIKQSASGKIRAIRERSLQIWGPQLFNSLPVNNRGQTGCSVTSFKHKFYKYLQNISDKLWLEGIHNGHYYLLCCSLYVVFSFYVYVYHHDLNSSGNESGIICVWLLFRGNDDMLLCYTISWCLLQIVHVIGVISLYIIPAYPFHHPHRRQITL